jgi:glycerate 2-kinase
MNLDRDVLLDLFRAAVAAADPTAALRANLPEKPKGRTIVIGAGKASAVLAKAFEDAWDAPLTGLVVTRYGYAVPCQRIEIIEAAHPVPDEAGLAAAQRLIETVTGLTEDDLVVALISGGGSALLPAPATGMTLADEQAVNTALLASGAPIGAMNAIRNQVSTIKGGRLAARAAPARVATLVVSDIPGDDPALVASGPTIPIAATREQARQLVAIHNVVLPPAAAAVLASDANIPPPPDDPRFTRNSVRIIASAGLSLRAAADRARALGLEPVVLSDAIEGEAREIGRKHAEIALETAIRNRPLRKPIVILSGGETTVTLRGKGRGGRNSEFLLSLAMAIEGEEGISALAADTDGIDGSEDNAGAFADGTSTARMRTAGADPLAALANNDAWGAFNAVDGLIVTGPTGTNVNDFRAILVR